MQSGVGGLLGGSRMQYHLRQSFGSVDAIVSIEPEVPLAFASDKFDAKRLS